MSVVLLECHFFKTINRMDSCAMPQEDTNRLCFVCIHVFWNKNQYSSQHKLLGPTYQHLEAKLLSYVTYRVAFFYSVLRFIKKEKKSFHNCYAPWWHSTANKNINSRAHNKQFLLGKNSGDKSCTRDMRYLTTTNYVYNYNWCQEHVIKE